MSNRARFTAKGPRPASGWYVWPILALIVGGMTGALVAFSLGPTGAGPTASTARITADAGESLTFAPLTGPVGTSIVLSGSGYFPTATVTAFYNGTAESCQEGSVTVGLGGTFTCTIVAPPSPNGSYYVIGADSTLDPLTNATQNFTIDQFVAVAPSSGHVGTSVTVTGTGFSATATASVVWDSTTPLCGSTTDADGSFSCAGSVPPSELGTNFVLAETGSIQNSTTFSVTTSFALSVSDGPPGTITTLTGNGFDPSLSYDYCLQTTSVACTVAVSSFSPETNGSIPSGVTLTVPDSETAGSYFVDVSTSGTFVISAGFEVTSETLELSPTSGAVGTAITLSGSGYAPDDSYSYCYQATSASCLAGAPTFVADSSGDIPSGTVVDASASTDGAHDVDVFLSSTLLVSVGFTVEPALAVAPTSGAVGTAVTATGTGLDATAAFNLTWAGATVNCTDANTTSLGNATCAFDVPPTPGGTASLVLTEGALAPSTTFTVTVSFVSSPTSGPVGTSVDWIGEGFPASTAFTVAWNISTSGTLCSGTSGTDGTAGCTADVPTAPSGTYSVQDSTVGVVATTDFLVVAALAVSPDAGPSGTAAVATGTGFDASVPYTLTWDTSTALCAGSSTLADGSFSCAFDVPASTGGPNTLLAEEGTNSASTTFTIGAAISISSNTGFVGAAVSVTGVGFDPSSNYNLVWDNVTILCNGTTSSAGGFGCSFDVPTTPAGVHNVTAVEGVYSPTVLFTVAPSLLLSASQGPPGAPVNATGAGFAGSATFALAFAGATLCNGTTYPDGGFACSFVLPDAPGGQSTISAATGSNEASASFNVVALLGQSTGSGIVGSAVTALGAGFTAMTEVSVYWNTSTPLCSANASSVGSFACQYTVPTAAGGAHLVDAIQGSETVSATFSVVPAVSVNPTTAKVGASVQVTGTGFVAEEHVAVLWNSTSTLCNPLANTNGGFTCSFVVPASGAGPVSISGEQGTYAPSVYFTVLAGPPVPGPSSSASPVPWWAVIAGAVIVGLVLVGLIVFEIGRGRRSRRRSTGSPGTAPVQAWQGVPESPGSGGPTPGGPPAPAPAVPAPVPTSGGGTTSGGAEPPEDIDVLIQRLERMSQQMFKKSPRELSSDEGTTEDEKPPN